MKQLFRIIAFLVVTIPGLQAQAQTPQLNAEWTIEFKRQHIRDTFFQSYWTPTLAKAENGDVMLFIGHGSSNGFRGSIDIYRIDPTGKMVWAAPFSYKSGSNPSVVSVTVKKDIAYFTVRSIGMTDLELVAFDIETQSLLWVINPASVLPPTYDFLEYHTDGEGLYLTASNGKGFLDSICIVSLGPDGSFQRSVQLLNIWGNTYTHATLIGSRIYFIGSTNPNSFESDLYTSACIYEVNTQNGSLMKKSHFPKSASSPIGEFRSISSNDTSLYVYGISSYKATLVCYNMNLDTNWTRSFDPMSSQYSFYHLILLDETGTPHLVRSFADDYQHTFEYVTFDTDGVQRSKAYYTNNLSMFMPYSIVASKDALYIGATLELGEGNPSIVRKLSMPATKVERQAEQSLLLTFASNTLHFHFGGSVSNATVKISDVLGKLQYEFHSIHGNEFSFMPQLPAGVYLYSVFAADGFIANGKWIKP